jgi:hypothetical protein
MDAVAIGGSPVRVMAVTMVRVCRAVVDSTVRSPVMQSAIVWATGRVGARCTVARVGRMWDMGSASRAKSR